MRRPSIAAAASLCLLLTPLLSQAGPNGRTFTFSSKPVDCGKSNATANPFGQCAAGTRPAAVAPQPAAPSRPTTTVAAAPVRPAAAASAVNSATAGYVKCADFNQLCKVSEPSLAIWGKGMKFSIAKVLDKSFWCNGSLGADSPDNHGSACWTKPIGVPKDTTGSDMASTLPTPTPTPAPAPAPAPTAAEHASLEPNAPGRRHER
jgi:hypothetical protein